MKCDLDMLIPICKLEIKVKVTLENNRNVRKQHKPVDERINKIGDWKQTISNFSFSNQSTKKQS